MAGLLVLPVLAPTSAHAQEPRIDLDRVDFTLVGSTARPQRSGAGEPAEPTPGIRAPHLRAEDRPETAGEDPEWTTPYQEAPQVYGVCDWSVMGGDVVAALDAGAPIEGYYQACAPAVQAPFTALGETLGDDEARAVFATVIAYSFAPYGNSTARWLHELAGESVLDCDNYALLAHYIYAALGGTETFWLLGWNGGALGNHAQIYYESGTRRMILDPTVAMISLTDMDAVMDGGAGAALTGVSFYWRPAWETDWMLHYLPLAHGEGMPWCALLYFATAEQYTGAMWTGSSYWPTPGARVLDGLIAKC